MRLRFALIAMLLFPTFLAVSALAADGHNYQNIFSCRSSLGEMRVDSFQGADVVGFGQRWYLQVVFTDGWKDELAAAGFQSTKVGQANEFIIDKLSGGLIQGDKLQATPSWHGDRPATRIWGFLTEKSFTLTQAWDASLVTREIQFDHCS